MFATRLISGAVFLLATLLVAGVAVADLSGDLKIRMVDPAGTETLQSGKIYLQGPAADEERNVRLEIESPDQPDGDAIIITRPRDDVGYMLFPEMKSYMTLDLDAEEPGTAAEEIRDEDLETVGRAEVEGYDTVVKRGPVVHNGREIGQITMYVAEELDDEPIRSHFEHEDGSVTETLIQNPDRADLPDELFQPPPDYQETLIPGMEQLLEDLEDEMQDDAPGQTEPGSPEDNGAEFDL